MAGLVAEPISAAAKVSVVAVATTFAALLEPHLMPFLWGTAGAFASAVFVPIIPPITILRHIARILASAVIAAGCTAGLTHLFGLNAISGQTFAAIILGVGAPQIVFTVATKIGEWLDNFVKAKTGSREDDRHRYRRPPYRPPFDDRHRRHPPPNDGNGDKDE